MIKRTSRKYMLEIIKNNPDWSILDLGSGIQGWLCAKTYCDVTDCSEHYPEGDFVQAPADDTPFFDKEFDFVVATHVAEHVPNPEKFLKELMRISDRGYIEVPTPFFDNITQGNSNPPPHGHLWWVSFDDDANEIVFKPRIHILEEAISPANTTVLLPFFEDNMVTRLYWEKEIPFREEQLIFTHIIGNGDPDKRIDLRDKEIPKFRWRG